MGFVEEWLFFWLQCRLISITFNPKCPESPTPHPGSQSDPSQRYGVSLIAVLDLFQASFGLENLFSHLLPGIRVVQVVRRVSSLFQSFDLFSISATVLLCM